MPYTFPDTYESIVKEENINDGGSIQMEWNDTGNTPLPVGTACPIDPDYVLLTDYYPAQSSVGSYRYSVRFPHRLAQTDYLPFYFRTRAVTGVENGEAQSEEIILSTYPYTGNIQTIAQSLADSLTEHGDLGEWTADTGELSASVTASISFDGATIKSAAAAIADAFGVDYWFDWATHAIRFGTLEASAPLPSGSAVVPDANGVTEGLYALVSASDGEVQYNVFRILGGTRNMSKKNIQGKNIQVTQRLMLDDEEGITDSIIDTRPAGSALPKIMKDLVFDDVFPKMELWLYDLHERRCWLTDENGQKIVDTQGVDPETGGTVTTYKTYSKWYFKLAYWDGTTLRQYSSFQKDYIIEGMTLSMVFQPNYEEGALPQPLVGREFELAYFDSPNPAREKEDDDIDPNGYQPSQGEFRIIFKVEGDMILPSTREETIVPYAVTEGGVPVMSRLANKVTLTNVAMDSIYMATAKAELRKAAEDAILAYRKDKRSFTYTTYGDPPSLGGNISSVRTDLITGEVQYTVGDYKSSKGLIGRLSDKIESATSGGGGAAANESESTPRGGGVSELSIPILSRLMGSGNVVKDTLTILKELILGTNGQGVKIDLNGDASMTIGSLTVLGATHLNEIDINHIRHTGGLMVVTKANIIVDGCEQLDGGLWKLYFRRRDGSGQAIVNLFEVGDFALMMTFNEELSGSVNRFFWREVVAVGTETETVIGELTQQTTEAETDRGYITLNYGTYNTLPKEGDVVVQLGNRSVSERQGATVLGGSGPNGGFMAIYDGFKTIANAAPALDSYDNALIYLSPKRNKITGNFISLAGDNLDEKLGTLTGIINSIRQQSDKQLVIWYGDDDAPLPNSEDTEHWNTPASDWHDADALAGNTEQQELHAEDVFYLRRNNTTRTGGRAWQWTYDAVSDIYLWVEITDADTIAALEAADDAVETANEAKTLVESLADDGIISAGSEKSELLISWQDTVAEYVQLIEQAGDYDLDDVPDTYDSAVLVSRSPYNEYTYRYRELAIMLNDGSLDNINSIMAGTVTVPDVTMIPQWLQDLDTSVVLAAAMGGTGITADQYRATWKGYSEARAALLKAIEEAAKLLADEAHGRIDDIESDGVISAGSEKTALHMDWLEAVAEYREYVAQAKDYALDEDSNANSPYNAYAGAYTALALMLNDGESDNIAQVMAGAAVPLWLELSGSTYLKEEGSGQHPTPSDYRNTWDGYYNARAVLLSAIEEAALAMTEEAQATADEALGRIDDIVADGKLTSDELPSLKREFETAYRERAKMADLATDDTTHKLIDAVLRAPLDTYLAAFKAMADYMMMGGGAWPEPSDDTDHTYGYDVSNGSNVTDANARYDVVAKAPLAGPDFPVLLGISSAVVLKADWSDQDGDNGAQFRNLWAALMEKQTSLANAMATLAKDNADAAQADVDRLADDGIISGGSEKSVLLIDWMKTVAEYMKYTEQAADYFGADNTQDDALVLAYRKLAAMLSNLNPETQHDNVSESILTGSARPSWIDSGHIGEDTVLSDTPTGTAEAYRGVWNAYHTALASLLEAITSKAKELADSAQEDATLALSRISDMGSDGKLDASEKLTVKREFLAAWHERDDEGGLLDKCRDANQNYINATIGTAYVTPYLNAFKAVGSFLNGRTGGSPTAWTGITITSQTTDAQIENAMPLWLQSSNMGVTDTVDGDGWRDVWAAFFSARTALMTALSEDAKDRADDALEKIGDLVDDGIISGGSEKSKLLMDWRKTVYEYLTYREQANDYGISSGSAYQTYYNAYRELVKMLNGGENPSEGAMMIGTATPAWLSSLDEDTVLSDYDIMENQKLVNLTAAIYRRKWNTYNSSLTDLLNAIAAKSKELTEAAQADATAALEAIAGIAADGELSTTEIPDLKREFETAYRQRGEMADLATFDFEQGSSNNYKLVDLNLFTPLNAYLAAFKAMADYLNRQGGSNGSGGTYGAWTEPGTYNVSNGTAEAATYNVGTKTPLADTDFPVLLRSTDNVKFQADWAHPTTDGDGGVAFRNLWADLEKKRIGLANAMATITNDKADSAISRLDYISDDGVLDPSEKVVVKREFVSAWKERDEEGGIVDKAIDNNLQPISAEVGTALYAYLNAFDAIGNYLNGGVTWFTDPLTQEVDESPAYSLPNLNAKIPVWLQTAKMGQTEVLTKPSTFTGEAGDYWRSLWSAFYSARTELLTALSDEAKKRADNAQTTANNKKRVFTTSPNQLPPAPYDVGDLWVNATWYTSETVNGETTTTYTWNQDTLICVTACSTNNNRSISDWADAAAGTTAKIQNIGDRIDLEVQNRKSGTSSMLRLDESTGTLSLSSYDPATDSWSTLASIGLALEKAGTSFTGKLRLSANNTYITTDLFSLIAENVNIDADHIKFTAIDTSMDLQSGLVKLLLDNLGGVSGDTAPSQCESVSWSGAPLNPSYNYPYVWMRCDVREGGSLVSQTYTRIKKPTDSGNGYSAQFASSATPEAADIHNEFVSGDIYMRLKGETDSDWGAWFLVVGEQWDASGSGKRYYFNRSKSSSIASGYTETKAFQQQLGMVIRQEGSNGEFSFGTYVNGVFSQGLRFVTDNGASRLLLSADTTEVAGDFKVSAATNINFQGEEIELTGSTLSFVGGTLDFSGTTILFGANEIEIDTDNLVIDASKVIVGTGGSTATLRDGLVSLLVNQISSDNAADIQKSLGMVIRREGSGGTFSFGSYVNDNFVAGLQFKEETIDGVTTRKLLLSADTTEVNSDFMVNAGNINFDGESITISSGRSLTFIGNGTIDFRGTTVRLNANDIQVIADSGVSVDVSQVTFNSGGVAATLEDGLVSLFMTQLDSNNTQSLQQQLGMVIRQSGTNNEFSFGSYVNGTFRAGLQFKLVNNNQTKLMLTSNNVEIGTDLLTLISSQITVNTDNLQIDAEQVNFQTGEFYVGGTSASDAYFSIDSSGKVTMRDLTVLGNSTFHGSVSGIILPTVDLYHNVCMVVSYGNNNVGNADIVVIGGHDINTAAEDIIITLPNPDGCHYKVVTIYGAQKPASLKTNNVTIRLAVSGSSLDIRTPWGTTCIDGQSNNLRDMNEMVLMSQYVSVLGYTPAWKWCVFKYTVTETTNGNTYVKDALSGLN